MKTLFALVVVASGLLFAACGKKKPVIESTYTDYDRGYWYWYNDKNDSAFFFFNRYVNNPDDVFKKGVAFKFMGEIQAKKGDIFGAEENLTNAIHTLDSSDKKHRKELGLAYNDLGNLSLDSRQYDTAARFYDIALAFVKDSAFALEALNGKATTLNKMKKYGEAIMIYDSILTLHPTDQSLIARIIDNKARTQWLQNKAYNALPQMWQALKIRTDSNDSTGLNASYAHLSDYYAASLPDSARWYATKMYHIALENRSPADVLEAIDKLIRLNPSSVEKQSWYNEMVRLQDSVQFVKDTASNRFAFVRYDNKKINNDNLLLKKFIRTQRQLGISLFLLLSAGIFALVLWFRKRRKKIRYEAEQSIRESRLKTSQKVHDVVANGLYTIMNELEHLDAIEKEALINKIEELYERSRNISYEEHLTDGGPDYTTKVQELLNSFSTRETDVYMLGNEPEYWNNIAAGKKEQLFLVIKELLVNMKKHSAAHNVSFIFRQENNTGYIQYMDDGNGFPAALEYGNGLKNTVNRINSLGGETIFGKSEKAGASVTISFPL